ncbi:MAG: hypothetical protein KatS3mg108_3490 [Isosphaeraceae bacterium]|nr:MAG: hypothetical protein KatS3mg108_3490 [Isosphaeraceae bacterium]
MSGDLSGFSLHDLFRSEAEGQIAQLTDGLLALESAADPAAVVEPIMRAAHSLKGAARIVGLTAAERLAHALEDVFVAAQKGQIRLEPVHIDRLLADVDLLATIARLNEGEGDAWLAAHQTELDQRINDLKAIEAGTWTPPTPAQTTRSTATADVEQPPSAPANPSATTSPAGREASDSLSPSASDPSRTAAASVPAAQAADQRRASRSSRRKPRQRSEPPANPVPTVDPPVHPKPGAQPATAPAAAPTPSAAAAGSAAAADTPDRVVRVTAENLNRLMGLAGESLVQARQLRPLVDSLRQLKTIHDGLAKVLQALDDQLGTTVGRYAPTTREQLASARQQAARLMEVLSERTERIEDHARRGEDLAERLHHEVISSRLRPLADGVRGFPRLVRDTARQLGKQVRFEVVGEQTGVDRDILEKLEAPLNHLIRNALDHGIEPPDARLAAGKDPTATIRLEGRHVAGMLQIHLSDDGAGIPVESVRARVIERNLASAAMAAQMSESELLEFLFLPGFSTKTEVSSLSGRGVGLDVVQSMVQSVGGSVRVSTRVGLGTTFTLQLPITMSVIRALIVRIAGQPYAFPLSRLESIQRIPVELVETIEGRPFFTLDGQAVGLVNAAEILEIPASPPSEAALPIAVVSDRGHRFGVVVDQILGERDLDVRPLDPRLGKVPDINSASILEDGWPVLILDVEDLVRSIDNLIHGRRFKLLDPKSPASTQQSAKRVLVVDDSITVRELERQLLESHGYAVDVAIDGMDGWNAVRSTRYDLVVSDIDMPRMDGIQLVTQIRRDPRLKTLPIVIVSYKDREEDRLRGLDAGASCYLTKSSFHDQTFLQAIADLIGDSDS